MTRPMRCVAPSARSDLYPRDDRPTQLLQQASAASFTSVQSGAWSDPATWGTGSQAGASTSRLPSSNDDVFIASGTTVIVDTTVNTLVNSVNVQPRAVLTCPRNAQLGSTPELTELGLALSFLRVEGGGCFSCGYGNCTDDAEPFAGKFVLRLTSDAPPASAEDNVRTLMVESGGALFLSGAPRVRPVTRLAEHAEAGQTILRVSDPDVCRYRQRALQQHNPGASATASSSRPPTGRRIRPSTAPSSALMLTLQRNFSSPHARRPAAICAQRSHDFICQQGRRQPQSHGGRPRRNCAAVAQRRDRGHQRRRHGT